MPEQLLPKYQKPPVVEVAISVFFKPLPLFKSAHFGRFWDLNPDYVSAEDQPPVFDGGGLPPGSILGPFPRVFLVTENSNYVIQLQTDFFAHNWRKVRPDDAYPSFEKAKGLFLERWRVFGDFVRDNKLGDLHLSRYEVTYVNHFAEEDQGAFPLAISKYSPLIVLRESGKDDFLPNARALSADLQFEIRESKGILKVSLRQGVRPLDQRDVMQMDLSARSDAKPDGSDMAEWLEVAHEWIVRGFTELTTPDAHQKWERIQ